MTTSRQIFAELLSAEAGGARARFNLTDLRRTWFRYEFCADDADADAGLVARLYNSAEGKLAEERLSEVRDRYIALANEAAEPDLPVLQSKGCLEIAPLFIATQHLIHALCGNWNNEDRYALTALRVHAIDVGCGQPRASRIDRYREILRTLCAGDVGADVLRTAADTRISDGAFSFASKLMLLGCFPQSLAGEILGANLFFRTSGRFALFELLRRTSDPQLSFLDLGRSPDGDNGAPRELSVEAAQAYAAERGARLSSVVAGFHWASECTAEVLRRALEVLVRWSDPREAAIQLIHRRRHDASQYHKATNLSGENMSDLFAQNDPQGFIERLAISEFVRPGEPEKSPLLNGLISPRSKMFRIFSRDEIQVLDRWIKGLPYKTAPLKPSAFELWRDDDVAPGHGADQNASVAALRAKPRQIYRRLLHTEITAPESAYAQDYVANWLKRSARSVFAGACPLPERWRAGELKAWLRDRHEASNDLADQAQAQIPTREDVVANACSLAPLTMIDGAWLAGFAHPALASTDWAYGLFETFFDELGNGIYELNHPTIYRDLMRNICGGLPPTHHATYAQQAFFADKDFELPVFWLSIGRFPLSYRAELLGLNLAMELSGVGGGYRQTGRALAAYGFPTMFVQLHNSIDNISTGHTAWAAVSIDAFMSELPRCDQDATWLRIRTGFVALNPPSRHPIVAKLKTRLKSML